MSEPKLGDVLLRGSLDLGFELLDAIDLRHIAKNLPSVQAAVETARAYGAGQVWQQNVDLRGRVLGEPFRLLRPPVPISLPRAVPRDARAAIAHDREPVRRSRSGRRALKRLPK